MSEKPTMSKTDNSEIGGRRAEAIQNSACKTLPTSEPNITQEKISNIDGSCGDVPKIEPVQVDKCSTTDIIIPLVKSVGVNTDFEFIYRDPKTVPKKSVSTNTDHVDSGEAISIDECVSKIETIQLQEEQSSSNIEIETRDTSETPAEPAESHEDSKDIRSEMISSDLIETNEENTFSKSANYLEETKTSEASCSLDQANILEKVKSLEEFLDIDDGKSADEEKSSDSDSPEEFTFENLITNRNPIDDSFDSSKNESGTTEDLESSFDDAAKTSPDKAETKKEKRDRKKKKKERHSSESKKSRTRKHSNVDEVAICGCDDSEEQMGEEMEKKPSKKIVPDAAASTSVQTILKKKRRKSGASVPKPKNTETALLIKEAQARKSGSPKDESKFISKTEQQKRKQEEIQKEVMFLEEIMKHMRSENMIAARAVLMDEDNLHHVLNTVNHLVQLTIFYINSKHKVSKPIMYQDSKIMMKHVAKVGDPDDVILYLIPEIQKTKDDERFLCIMKPLQIALQRLPKKKSKYFAWSLGAIYRYLLDLPKPDVYPGLDGNELLLLDTDPHVVKISSVYFDLLPFFEPFVIQYQRAPLRDDADVKNLFLRYIPMSLDKPFAYLDLEVRKKTKPKARRVVEKYIEYITTMMPDIFLYLEYRTSVDDPTKINDICLAMFFYLVLCDGVCLEKVPKIYSPLYIFQKCIFFVLAFLNLDTQINIVRALRFSEYLVDTLEPFSVPCYCLDSIAHSRFFRNLAQQLIYNLNKEYRSRFLKVFSKYLHLFDYKGRFQIIYNLLLDSCVTSNLASYIISLYKEMYVIEINKNDKLLNQYFSGVKFLTLIKLFTNLPEKEETDLVNISDRLIAALNFLRFVILRDRQNASKLWDHIKEVEETFLIPLKKGLLLSKGHYQAKIIEVEKETEDDPVDISISIGGKNLVDMPKSEKISVLTSAMTTFDVIDSILCTLNEDIEKRKSQILNNS